MRSLTGGVCIKLLTKLRHNQRSPLARLHIRHHKPIGIRCRASVLGTMREVPMRDDRFEVSVSFDERRGYVAKSACRAPGRLRALFCGGGPALRWEEVHAGACHAQDDSLDG
jgi:hypothetical protein